MPLLLLQHFQETKSSFSHDYLLKSHQLQSSLLKIRDNYKPMPTPHCQNKKQIGFPYFFENPIYFTFPTVL